MGDPSIRAFKFGIRIFTSNDIDKWSQNIAHGMMEQTRRHTKYTYKLHSIREPNNVILFIAIAVYGGTLVHIYIQELEAKFRAAFSFHNNLEETTISTFDGMLRLNSANCHIIHIYSSPSDWIFPARITAAGKWSI